MSFIRGSFAILGIVLAPVVVISALSAAFDQQPTIEEHP